jgi:hypothetical protein
MISELLTVGADESVDVLCRYFSPALDSLAHPFHDRHREHGTTGVAEQRSCLAEEAAPDAAPSSDDEQRRVDSTRRAKDLFRPLSDHDFG